MLERSKIKNDKNILQWLDYIEVIEKRRIGSRKLRTFSHTCFLHFWKKKCKYDFMGKKVIALTTLMKKAEKIICV